MAALSTHTPPNPATIVLDAPRDHVLPPVLADLRDDLLDPDATAEELAAANTVLDCLTELDGIEARKNRAHRRADAADNSRDDLPPDHPARLLSRTGAESVIFRAARAAVLARATNDPAQLVEQITAALPADALSGPQLDRTLAEALDTLNVDATSLASDSVEYLAALICSLLTDRATGTAAEHNDYLTLIIIVMLATAVELIAETTATATEHPTERIDRQPPPPILHILTTCVLTSAPPALDTTCAECSAALPMTR